MNHKHCEGLQRASDFQYVALAVQPTARDTLPVDDDGEVDDAASNSSNSSSSTIALQQHRQILKTCPPEFRRHNQHKGRILFDPCEAQN